MTLKSRIKAQLTETQWPSKHTFRVGDKVKVRGQEDDPVKLRVVHVMGHAVHVANDAGRMDQYHHSELVKSHMAEETQLDEAKGDDEKIANHPHDILRNPHDYNVQDVFKAFHSKTATDLHKRVLGKHLDNHFGHKDWRKLPKNHKMRFSESNEIPKDNQLDELSKKTLGSYIRSASGSMAGDAVEHGASITHDKPAGDKRSYDRIKKRLKGIARAANKIVKEEALTEGGFIVHHRTTNKVAKHTQTYNAALRHADKLNANAAPGQHEWEIHSHEYWQDHILPKHKPAMKEETITECDNLKTGERVRIDGHEAHDGKTGEVFGKDKEMHKVKIDGEDYQPWVHKSQLRRLGEETIIESRGKTIDKIKDAYGNQYEHRTDVFHGTDAVVKTHQHGEKLDQDHHIHMGKSAYVRAKWKETKKHVDLVNAGTISFPGAKRQ